MSSPAHTALARLRSEKTAMEFPHFLAQGMGHLVEHAPMYVEQARHLISENPLTSVAGGMVVGGVPAWKGGRAFQAVKDTSKNVFNGLASGGASVGRGIASAGQHVRGRVDALKKLGAFTPGFIHNIARDGDVDVGAPAFKEKCRGLTGKAHLDDMSSGQLGEVVKMILTEKQAVSSRFVNNALVAAKSKTQVARDAGLLSGSVESQQEGRLIAAAAKRRQRPMMPWQREGKVPNPTTW